MSDALKALKEFGEKFERIEIFEIEGVKIGLRNLTADEDIKVYQVVTEIKDNSAFNSVVNRLQKIEKLSRAVVSIGDVKVDYRLDNKILLDIKDAISNWSYDIVDRMAEKLDQMAFETSEKFDKALNINPEIEAKKIMHMINKFGGNFSNPNEEIPKEPEEVK